MGFHAYDKDPPIKQSNTVAIPRAQYEALVMAKEAVKFLHERTDHSNTYPDDKPCSCILCATLAALRAAGIQIEDKAND